MLTYCWLSVTSLLAGAMNSVAGGGTLLTFPALVTVISYEAANATSTVALFPGAFAGAWGYRSQLGEARRWLTILLVPSLIGGVIGSKLVTVLPDKVFRALVPWLILLAALLFLAQPLVSRLVKQQSGAPVGASSVAAVVFFQLLVAIYGGYFGAGIGILMLSSLAFMGLNDIHQMNALKTVLSASINTAAAITFAFDGVVHWPIALFMAISAIIGGYLGARLSLRIRPVYVRWVVIVIGFGLSGYFFYTQWTQSAGDVQATVGK